MRDSIYKKLVNALFKLSGGQAMPKTGDYTVIEKTETNFVIPYSGYLKVFSLTSNMNTPWLNVTVNNSLAMILPCVNSLQGLSCVVLPVKKGDSISILSNGIQVDGIHLFKLVGGGINRLLSLAQARIRGGVLCLLTSSILFARYLSCRVLKRYQVDRLSRLVFRQLTSILSTPHRATAISLLESKTQRIVELFKSKQTQFPAFGRATMKSQARFGERTFLCAKGKLHKHLFDMTRRGCLKYYSFLRLALLKVNAMEVCHA